jgi:hypothetical protein
VSNAIKSAVFAGAVWMLWNGHAGAAEPLAGVLACRTVTDPTARLACFDRETAHLDVKSVAATVAAPPAPTLNPEQQFGLPERAVVTQEIAAGARASDAPKIEAHVVRLSQTQDGRTVFALDNDQVWRQLLTSGELLVRVGDVVTISRAMLGSFWLQTTTGRGCKVTRVR